MAKHTGEPSRQKVAKTFQATLDGYLKRPPDDAITIADPMYAGLALRVGRRGKPAWTYRFRFKGVLHREALGLYPDTSIGDAHRIVDEAKEKLRRGDDPFPAGVKDPRPVDTFEIVAEQFIERHVSGLRSAKPVTADIRRHLIPKWGMRPIATITDEDVAAVLQRVAEDNGPYAAHRLYAYVSKLFNWAIARRTYGIERNPCDRIDATELIGEKKARQRILSNDELRLFWRATGQTEAPFGPLFRVLLLTAQRRDEVAEMAWPEIALHEIELADKTSTKRRVWTLPSERMKADAPHVAPLSERALALLDTLPRHVGDEKEGDYVFTTTAGRRPVSGFSKAKLRLDATMLKLARRDAEERGEDWSTVTLKPWQLHDLRRTARTHFSAVSSSSDLVRELAISHTKPGLHKVYDQWAYLREKWELFEAWAARLESIVEPEKVAQQHPKPVRKRLKFQIRRSDLHAAG